MREEAWMEAGGAVVINVSQLLQMLLVVGEGVSLCKPHWQLLGPCLRLLQPLIYEIRDTAAIADAAHAIPDANVAFLRLLDRALSKLREVVAKCGDDGSAISKVIRSVEAPKWFQVASLLLEEALEVTELEVSEHNKCQAKACLGELRNARYLPDISDLMLHNEIEMALVELRERHRVRQDKLRKLLDKLGISTAGALSAEMAALEQLRDEARATKRKSEEEYMDRIISMLMQAVERDQQAADDSSGGAAVRSAAEAKGVCIPADFRCPLCLELMADPVIIASGQTYERAYIQQWLEQGNTTCPKTRKQLAHHNLIPNYTVKALISSWCDVNNLPLPLPPSLPKRQQHSSSLRQQHSSSLRQQLEQGIENPHHHHLQGSSDVAEIDAQGGATVAAAAAAAPVTAGEDDEGGFVVRGAKLRAAATKANSFAGYGRTSGDWSYLSFPSAINNNRSSSKSGTSPWSDSSAEDAELSLMSDSSPYNSDAGGSGSPYYRSSSSSGSSNEQQQVQQERKQQLLREQQQQQRSKRGRLGRVVSERSMSDEALLSLIGNQVEDLRSGDAERQAAAAAELRLLSRHDAENRVLIADAGAMPALLPLAEGCCSAAAQEDAVTALLNLSLDERNRRWMAGEPRALAALVAALSVKADVGVGAGNGDGNGGVNDGGNAGGSGSCGAATAENAAAALASIASGGEAAAVAVGRVAMVGLVGMLEGEGTSGRGRKDAATALFGLCGVAENRARAAGAGAVRACVALLTRRAGAEAAAGCGDKAAALLARLATAAEGRVALGAEEGAVAALVEVVEAGSPRGRENAAAALLQLCTHSSRHRALVLREGAIPPLHALSQSGTPRAKEKASALLRHFREQRNASFGSRASQQFWS